jgi:erythromycin esterase
MKIMNMKKLLALLAAAVPLLLSPAASGAQALDSAVDAARPPGYPVAPGIWKLHGQQPGLATNDLEPLRRMVGKASVVALGESFHTSGGFYVTKHRVFRFLVEKMGFRVFAIESNWTRADDAARYVQTCEGTPEQALRGHIPVWPSTELADMLRWMCEWNSNHPKAADKVHYFGFDIQQAQIDGRALIDFLPRIGIMPTHPWIGGIESCEGVTRRHPLGEVPPERHDRCLQTLAEIEAHLQTNANEIRERTSAEDLEIAKIRVVGLRADENQMFLIFHDFGAGYSARDVAMANTFLKLREMRFPKAKTMIWAANSHVSKSTLPNGATPMGMHLAAALKRDYVTFALGAYVTEVDYGRCGPVDLVPGSVDERLNGLGPDTLFVDFAFPGTRRPYLPKGLLHIGSEEFDLKRHFNGMFWMRHSAKMTPTLWEPCQ